MGFHGQLAPLGLMRRWPNTLVCILYFKMAKLTSAYVQKDETLDSSKHSVSDSVLYSWLSMM